MKVPTSNNLHYSFWPGPHYLVNDDGNVVGCLPAIKEIPLSEQEYTKVNNIIIYEEYQR